MTQVLLESFKDLTNWSTVAGTPLIATGRTGNAVQVSQTSRIRYTIPSPSESDIVTLGVAVLLAVAATTDFLWLRSDAAATDHLRFRSRTDGALLVTRAGTALTGGTSAASVLPLGAWFYLEVQAKLHDSTGYVIARVNGTDVINTTGRDTKNAGTKAVFDTVEINGTNTPPNVTAFDDLYLLTGVDSFRGDITIPEGVNAKTWNGSTFVDRAVRTWNGSAFVDAVAVKTWNGSTFV